MPDSLNSTALFDFSLFSSAPPKNLMRYWTLHCNDVTHKQIPLFSQSTALSTLHPPIMPPKGKGTVKASASSSLSSKTLILTTTNKDMNQACSIGDNNQLNRTLEHISHSETDSSNSSQPRVHVEDVSNNIQKDTTTCKVKDTKENIISNRKCKM